MKTRAYISVIAAMLIWGTLGIFTRYIGLSSAEMVLFRIIIGGLFLLIIYPFTKNRASGRSFRRALPLLLLSRALMGGCWLFLFEAYRCTSVSLATVGYYLCPVIVMLLSPLLFREKIQPIRVMGIMCALAGLILIAGTFSINSLNTRGFGFALIAAVLYAAVVLMNKYVKGLSGIEITLIQLAGAFLVMLPYTLISQNFVLAFPKGRSAIICLLILGIVHTGLALLLYFTSLKSLPAQSVAILSYVDPGSALVFSALFLNERLSTVQIIAAVLILGGAFMGEVFSKKSGYRGRAK